MVKKYKAKLRPLSHVWSLLCVTSGVFLLPVATSVKFSHYMCFNNNGYLLHLRIALWLALAGVRWLIM